MSTEPARFDPTQRRAAVRRTAWLIAGVIALIYAGFFVRAVLLMGTVGTGS